ncbi:hypothetical protein [Pantoea anthophila]|uniref:hypothetical protein n=1 Tax=Pantoea anthophila TaxID=470931 RepID=UPI002DBD4122|nr:hypothetical protein [Pantoea anthophila]MEB6224944.1 hypothetical protein [Pantoea anthophila]
MTHHTNKFLLMLALFLFNGFTEAKIPNQDIWRFITQSSASLKSLSVAHPKQFPLALTLETQNAFINVYHASSLKLKGDAKITDIELRISNISGGIAPFLSFSPAGKCITPDDVRKQYPAIKLSDYPRGQSENEVTSYTSPPDPEGQVIAFSFAVSNPDCLSKVIITAKE